MRDENGILVGSDITQEWLLPWWWDNYSTYNTHPVAFVDFGMSFEKKEWCRARGELIPLRIFADFVKEEPDIDPKHIETWEKNWGKRFWKCREAWFKKPLGCLQTPFQRTLWIDLDCEIRGNLSSLFEYTPLGLVHDHDTKEYPIYNSGVISYSRSLPLIETWAKLSVKENEKFVGDQDVLSYVIHQNAQAPSQIPKIYNWSRILEENNEAVILHWHGDHGKVVIQSQIQCQNLP